jgi:hypothetical protein
MALNNVPLTGQSLGITRVPINQNFSTINSAFGIDHVTMTPPGTAAPQGYHDQVSLVVQGSTPPTAWGTTYNGIYAYVPTLTNKAEVYIHGQKASGATEVPISASILSTTTPSSGIATGTSGWTYLPSGIIMKWGTVDVSGANAPIVFPTSANIPAFTQCLNIQLTLANAGGSPTDFVRVSTFTNLQFTYVVTNKDANSHLMYFAIGY